MVVAAVVAAMAVAAAAAVLVDDSVAALVRFVLFIVFFGGGREGKKKKKSFGCLGIGRGDKKNRHCEKRDPISKKKKYTALARMPFLVYFIDSLAYFIYNSFFF